MNRSELEHILRACREITGEADFVVVGSQSILGKHPDAPRALRKSMELDVFPRDRPDLADEIEGSLGALSLFDQTFGYHADGVGPETAVLPCGWEDRLVPVRSERTHGATGWCLDPYDLAYSKLVAGRPKKDLGFVAALLRFRLIGPVRLERHLQLAADPGLKANVSRSASGNETRKGRDGRGGFGIGSLVTLPATLEISRGPLKSQRAKS